ncbi:MAG: thrombospondin type 3 repeat-containing protein [Gammaproteobacteria bacterium]|nr:thrombospondin type 3 repeat-containing protein [Gammaproteobacteria bacterium]
MAVIFYNEGTNAGEAFIDNVKFDQYVEPDFDGDGVPDSVDNCPAHANPGQEDDDHDGVGNRCDDCTKVANPNQLDTNGDGYGNVCDADFNNDGVVNAPDLAYLRLAMGIPAYDGSPFQLYDLNQDGWVNIPDLVIFKSRWGTKAGPSGLKP